jgi:hypothetical protein
MAMLSGKSRELSRRVWRVAGLLTVSSNYLAGDIIIVAVDAGTELMADLMNDRWIYRF